MGTEKKSDGDAEEYSFIQEKVIPKARNSKKKRLKQFTVTISLAVVFGLVSSIVFNLVNYCINQGGNGNNGTVSLAQNNTISPEPEITASADAGDSDEKQEEDALSDYDIAQSFDILSYQKIYTLMSQINEDLKYSMVTVICYDDITSWLDLEKTEQSYGLIVADDDDSVYILCSYAKIKGISKIEASFYNDDKVSVSVCGYDKDTDLGILKASKSKIEKITEEKITKAVMSDSYQLSTGTPVLALGAPNGYVNSMLAGYVTDSGVNKYVVDGKLTMFHTSIDENTEGTGFFVNLSGQIVGVMTHDYQQDADKNMMSFIGISNLRPLIEDIINNKVRACLGIVAYELSNDEAKNFNTDYGIYVTDVASDSPAFNQGIKSGDVITEVDGKEISSVGALNSILRIHDPDDEITLKIIRVSNDEYPKTSFIEKSITVVLGKRSLGKSSS